MQRILKGLGMQNKVKPPFMQSVCHKASVIMRWNKGPTPVSKPGLAHWDYHCSTCLEVIEKAIFNDAVGSGVYPLRG